MIISLLTDYGRDDEFVGVCHGVIRGISPGVEIVDITHGVPRHGVRSGALALRNALPYMPLGVHVAVVDPGVGSARRALALRCGDGNLLVGPDNGLLSPAWRSCGGVVEVVELSRSPHRLEPVAATFHGRDIFAPVAARLAAGESLSDAGEALAAAGLRELALPAARREAGAVIAPVLTIDRFGNVALNVGDADLAHAGLAPGANVEIEAGGERYPATFARTFAEVGPGEAIVYQDAFGALAIAINEGDAGATMCLDEDAEVRLSGR